MPRSKDKLYWKCDCTNDNVHSVYIVSQCTSCSTEYQGDSQLAPLVDIIAYYMKRLKSQRNEKQPDSWVRGTHSDGQFIGVIEKIIEQSGKPKVAEIAVKFSQSEHLKTGELVYKELSEVEVHSPPMGYEMARKNVDNAITYSWARTTKDLSGARKLLKEALSMLDNPLVEAVEDPQMWLEFETK